jgi:hypothetical protein
MIVINIAAAVLGIWVFSVCWDRLRQITWSTARPSFVAMYLLMAVWASGVALDALLDSVGTYQLAGIVGSLIWIVLTRNLWRSGIPPYASNNEQHVGGERRSGFDRRYHP